MTWLSVVGAAASLAMQHCRAYTNFLRLIQDGVAFEEFDVEGVQLLTHEEKKVQFAAFAGNSHSCGRRISFCGPLIVGWIAASSEVGWPWRTAVARNRSSDMSSRC